MKSTGKFRRLDDLGRVMIPKEVRKELKLKECDLFEIFIDGDSVILKKHNAVSNRKIHDMSGQITFV